LQRTRKLFDNGRLARSAYRQITDANDEATQRPLAENPFAVKIEAQLDDALVNEGERVKNSAKDIRAKTVATTENDVDPELFQIF
jgi:hypothetical protein